MAYINVESKKIYIEEYGKENTKSIVIFHGGPAASCRGFENIATLLGVKYHVICFDQYGCARSDTIPENEPFGMTEHIDLIDKMRVVLGIKSWVIIGHSYGGTLACLYAYTYPNSTDSIIYIGASFDYGMAAKVQSAYLIPYFKRISSHEGLYKCIELLTTDFPTRKDTHDFYRTSIVPLIKDFREVCFYHKSIEELNNVPSIKIDSQPNPDNVLVKNNIHTKKIREGGEIYGDFYLYLENTDKQTLYIVGHCDPMGCDEIQDRYLNTAQKGMLVKFNSSGHFPHQEEPQRFVETIISFVDNL